MSVYAQPERLPEDGGAPAMAPPGIPAEAAPAPSAHPAVAHFRKGFKDSRHELLLSMGEDPKDYQEVVESVLVDLQPRPGLENCLADQLAETIWRMKRIQRMREGLALNNIRAKTQAQDTSVNLRAAQVFEAMEPFERLEAALQRRGMGPSPEEIDAFVESEKEKASPQVQEIIQLLESLKEPLDKQERKATRQKIRALLGPLMEGLGTMAWQSARQSERVRSSENLAALMAPRDPSSVLLQRMEDSALRQLWRLTNTFAKIRQGALREKDVKK